MLRMPQMISPVLTPNACSARRMPRSGASTASVSGMPRLVLRIGEKRISM